MKDTGLIHIYTGNGKGKTTAAIGLTIRMVGNDKKVIFSQFLKSWKTGEISILEKLENVKVIRNNNPFPFTNRMSSEQRIETIDIQNNILKEIILEVESGNYDMVVMDEIIATYNLGLVDTDLVDDFLKNKPQNLELVLTGREPSDILVSLAHYVSNIEKVKHPFDIGIESRKGIEI